MASRATIADIDRIVKGRTAPMSFLARVEHDPALPALHAAAGDGTWVTWTYAEYADMVARAAAGLGETGVDPGDRVLLLMRNRPDFHWFDLAAQFLRATPVSIYNSSSPEEIQYLASHAEAEVAIVEDAHFLARVQSVRSALPHLERVYVIDPPPGDLPDGVFPASELLDHGRADLAALAEATSPDDLATLIYTSGTTGPPKGVMISQHNVVYTVESLRQTIEVEDLAGKQAVSYLPMAHIAERMLSHYLATTVGLTVYCCPEASQLAGYLTQVRPEVLFGVPRVFEKIYHGVNAALAADPERKQQFDDGIAAALEIKAAERAGTATQEQLDTWAFLDAVAFAAVRGLVGLDNLLFAVSGAAPIPPQVLEWFNAIGVPLSEIYGMSESSGPMTWSPYRNKPGFVGEAIPGSEVRLDADGEVLTRGGHVFQGYFGQPDVTAQTLVDGWLHSGDLGEIDDDGYLRIVDRKKELIITSGGKNISPANLEASLKMIPLIGQAAAIGDGRKYVTALLVLDPESARAWAASHGKGDLTLDELADDPDVRAEIQAGVETVNQQFANAEQIKRFALVGEEWQPDSDVLTPTSKLKRRGIQSRYADRIDALYD